MLLHAALARVFPHRILRIPLVKHGFDSLERAYLLHWALEIATIHAVSISILLTFVIIAVSSNEDAI